MPAAFAVGLAFLLPAAATCALYVVPTLAGFWPRRRSAPGKGLSFAVLIPAHDEEAGLPATLRSVAAAEYPRERVRVIVVADNCTDGTAAVAHSHGVRCLERHDPDRRGKGFALAFALPHVLAAGPDVVLVLDADCELHPAALRELDARLAARADAVQAAVRSRNADDGPGGYVAAVGTAIDNAAAAGLDRLGLSVPLRGTGMAFRRGVLEAVSWDAHSVVEDAEYGDRLAKAGIRVCFAGRAVVACEAPADVAALVRQRRRWRAAVALPGQSVLLRSAVSKPLVLAQLAAAGAASVAAWLVAPSPGTLGCVAGAGVLALLTAGVYGRAVLEVGLSRHRVRLLLAAPVVVVRLGWLTLAGLVRRPPTTWDRTPRDNRNQAGRRAA